MSLIDYNKKRDFAKTTEPRGEPMQSADSARQRFVVQEHHASHLHYDFRLEIAGVLKSWAVPKGPPADYGVKRLAVMTEDHPLSYRTFSGTIPAGNYGAGKVSIWDSGTFENVGQFAPEEGLQRGKLEIVLQGDRLKGKYDLVRIDDEKNHWLLFRSKAAIAKAKHTTHADEASEFTGAKSASMPEPDAVRPMLATTVDAPFSDPDWQFEIKWDGYRALLFYDQNGSRLFSRNHQPLETAFHELESVGDFLQCREAVIDGEIVALDSEGRPQFQALQNRIGFRRGKKSASSVGDKATVVYMAFDLLHCDGIDLKSIPLVERRSLLKSLINPGGPLRYSDHVAGDGEALFAKLQAMRMEGVIAKRADSTYEMLRSPNWVKIKTHQTIDVAIGGYTESKGVGRPFGALLVGQYDGDRLVALGHIGTGFDKAMMDAIAQEMKPLQRKTPPFAEIPEVNGKIHWIEPKLVCEAKYSDKTADGQLRHPVFLRLRTDKPAQECQIGVDVKSEAAPALAAKSKQDVSRISTLARDDTQVDANITVQHHRVKLTHLSKVYWPETGTTKRDLLRYYAEVSDVLLPHLAKRPLVLQRYPNGVAEKSFFQHEIGDEPPPFVETYSIEEKNGLVHYALCDNLAALLYLVNLSSIPLHAWNITMDAPESPDQIVFDLDPGGDFVSAIFVAQMLHSILDELGLVSYPKTSGASGLHVCVPIAPIYSSEEVVGFARLVGEMARDKDSKLITLERRIKSRGGSQVYLDCVQNAVGKTVVAPYSVRARSTPTVSTPLKWEEVTPDLNSDLFTIDAVPDRIQKLGDLYMPATKSHQEIGAALEKIRRKTGP